EAQQLADQLLKNPETVAVAPPSTTVEKVDQEVFFVEKADKRALLVEVLADPSMTRVLVFSRTKHGANRIAEHLGKARVSAEGHPYESSNPAPEGWTARDDHSTHRGNAPARPQQARRGGGGGGGGGGGRRGGQRRGGRR